MKNTIYILFFFSYFSSFFDLSKINIAFFKKEIDKEIFYNGSKTLEETLKTENLRNFAYDKFTFVDFLKNNCDSVYFILEKDLIQASFFFKSGRLVQQKISNPTLFKNSINLKDLNESFFDKEFSKFLIFPKKFNIESEKKFIEENIKYSFIENGQKIKTFGEKNFDERLKIFAQNLGIKNNIFLGFTEKHGVLGQINYSKSKKNGHTFINYFFVNNELNTGKGIGNFLMNAFLEKIFESDPRINAIKLKALSNSKIFYDKFGFKSKDGINYKLKKSFKNN